MALAYDPDKSAANAVKHGIDFQAAQMLWDGPWRLEAPARTEDEARFLLVGRIGGRHWAAVWTPRGEDVHIISVRRARKEKVARYEGE